MIDENRFFREATLRICGSLDVKTFLHQSLLYIRQFIPADFVVLTRFYPEEGKQLALERMIKPMKEELGTRLLREFHLETRLFELYRNCERLSMEGELQGPTRDARRQRRGAG